MSGALGGPLGCHEAQPSPGPDEEGSLPASAPPRYRLGLPPQRWAIPHLHCSRLSLLFPVVPFIVWDQDPGNWHFHDPSFCCLPE